MTVIIDKVKKLLRLAESPNANEAALAAAKAQSLIDEHNLNTAMLELDGAEKTPDEPIEDFYAKGAPLDRSSQLQRWRGVLASNIAYANGCRIYYYGGDIALVGRASDAETVRYLFGYLQNEVNRLCDLEGKGCGRTWRNNFRLGVVDAINAKLRAGREQFKKDAQKAAGADSQALVRVNQGLAKVEQRGTDVREWVKSNLKLGSRSYSRAYGDSSGRAAGQKAGRSIEINRSRGALVNGKALGA